MIAKSLPFVLATAAFVYAVNGPEKTPYVHAYTTDPDNPGEYYTEDALRGLAARVGVELAWSLPLDQLQRAAGLLKTFGGELLSDDIRQNLTVLRDEQGAMAPTWGPSGDYPVTETATVYGSHRFGLTEIRD